LKTYSDGKFSFRVQHPTAIKICTKLTENRALSEHIENLLLRDSLSIPDTPSGLKEYKKNILEQIRVERELANEEIRRLKENKAYKLKALVEKLENVNAQLEREE